MSPLLIGDTLHVREPAVRRALERRDAAPLQQRVRRQLAAGAQVVALGLGPLLAAGPETARWAVETATDAGAARLLLETSNLAALEATLRAAPGRAIVSGMCAVPGRQAPVASLAAAHGSELVLLPLTETGLPITAEERLDLVGALLPAALGAGLAADALYVDLMVVTVAGGQGYAPGALQLVRGARRLDPALRTIATPASIADNAPRPWRTLLVAVYLALLVGAGLDALAADPADLAVAATLRALHRPGTAEERALQAIARAAHTGEELALAAALDSADPVARALNALLNLVPWQVALAVPPGA